MMKLRDVLLALLLINCIYSVGYAQCEPDSIKRRCTQNMSKGFNFIKSYTVHNQNNTRKDIEYSYAFTKGTKYVFQLCDKLSKCAIVLYDSKRNKVFDLPSTDKLTQVVFLSEATGIYYIHISFNGSLPVCQN